MAHLKFKLRLRFLTSKVWLFNPESRNFAFLWVFSLDFEEIRKNLRLFSLLEASNSISTYTLHKHSFYLANFNYFSTCKHSKLISHFKKLRFKEIKASKQHQIFTSFVWQTSHSHMNSQLSQKKYTTYYKTFLINIILLHIHKKK